MNCDATRLGEPRRLNRNLEQGYLVSKGITPAYVSSLLANPEAVGGFSRDGGDAAPFDVLQERIPQYAGAEDSECWYLHRADFERACQGYNATRTARHLANLGFLRSDEGRLTMKARPNLFGAKGKGRRAYVYGVRKTLAGVGVNLPSVA